MRTKVPAPTSSTWSAQSPLREYYLAVFRPRALKRRNLRYLEKYDLAVREFVDFCGGAVTLGQVSEELLAGYFVACREKETRSEKYCTNLRGAIRSIVRSWNVWGLPKIVPLPPAAEGTVRAHAEVYVAEAMVDCKAGTIEDTRRAMRRLFNHFGRDILLAELTDSLAAGFLRAMVEQKIPATTINSKLRAPLWAVWNHAVDRGLVDRPPRVKKLRENKPEPEAWTIAEMERLLAAAARFQPGLTYCGVPRNLWWHAALTVLWWSAMRRGALLSIKRENVDLENGIIAVEATAQKNRRAKRYLVGPDAIEAIGKIWLPERELLFAVESPRGLFEDFGAIIAAAGVRPHRRRGFNKFHAVRRTVATQVTARAGLAAASALLGHGDGYVTMRYVDPHQSGTLGVTRILPALAGPPPSDVRSARRDRRRHRGGAGEGKGEAAKTRRQKGRATATLPSPPKPSGRFAQRF